MRNVKSSPAHDKWDECGEAQMAMAQNFALALESIIIILSSLEIHTTQRFKKKSN